MTAKEIFKKYILPCLPYLCFFLVFANCWEAVRLAPGEDASAKLVGIKTGLALAFRNPLPGSWTDVFAGIVGAALARFAVYVKGMNAKKYRKNVEYGSARWSA